MITSTITYIGLLTMTEWFKVNAVAIILAVAAMFGSYSAQQVQLGKVEVRLASVENVQSEAEHYKVEFITLKTQVKRMQTDINEFNTNVKDLNAILSTLNITLTQFEGATSHTREKLDELQDTQKTILKDVQAIKLKVK